MSQQLVFCTGKIYYELVEEREKTGVTDVAIIRIEQLAPFPWDKVSAQIKKYNKATESVWCQEEPKNMGAYSFIEPRFRTTTRVLCGGEKGIMYTGRKPSAATATGLGGRAHDFEQVAIREAALKAGSGPQSI